MRSLTLLAVALAAAAATVAFGQPEYEVKAKEPNAQPEFMVGKIKLAPALAPSLATKLGRRLAQEAKPAAKKAPSPAPPSLKQGGAGAPAPAPAGGAKKPAAKPASKEPAKKPAAKPAATEPQPTTPTGQRRLRQVEAALAEKRAGAAPAPAPMMAKPASKPPPPKPAAPEAPPAEGGMRRLAQTDEPQALAESKAGAPAPAAAKKGPKEASPSAGEGEGGMRRLAQTDEPQALAESKAGAPAPAEAMKKKKTKEEAAAAGEEEEKGDRRRRRALLQSMETGIGGKGAAPPAGATFGAFPPAAPLAAAPTAPLAAAAPSAPLASAPSAPFGSGPAFYAAKAPSASLPYSAGAPSVAPGGTVGADAYAAIAANGAQFSTLKTLIDKAGLESALGAGYKGTLLAPTNAAFESYAASQGTNVAGLEAKNPADIKKLVAFHALDTKVDPAKVTGKETVTSLLPGAKVDVEKQAGVDAAPKVKPASYAAKPADAAPVFYNTAAGATIVPIDGVLVPGEKDMQASI